MHVYFISGLAADSRVFQHIHLPEGFEIIHLDWIAPVKNETLESYAARLAERIDLTEPFVLVGLSMGGMLVSEIAKIHPPLLSILVSSVPTADQLPPHFKMARILRLHRFVPTAFFKSASIAKRLFSVDKKEDKLVLKQVIRDSDPVFIKWAIDAILNWRNNTAPEHLWHIHGTKDEVLPMRYTRPTHVVEKGKHLMIMSRADELNDFLGEALRSLSNSGV
ncbi:MAG: hypothetical protein JWQ27_430 [Ferruginibacter sp.]|nr:hypothetical protein [Ferruginibacter sp.]